MTTESSVSESLFCGACGEPLMGEREHQARWGGTAPTGYTRFTPPAIADLERLVVACEDAYAGPEMDAHDDGEDISHPPSGITFGMIRRARAALEILRG